MKVNGENIPIFELDDQDTIINRIAAKLQTLPKYLYFPNGKPKADDKEVAVEDMLRYIKSLDSSQLKTLFDRMDEKAPTLNRYKDIFRPYIVYQKEFSGIQQDLTSFIFLPLEQQIKELKLFPSLDVDIQRDIWVNRKQIMTEITNEIAKNTEQVIKQQESFKAFKKSSKAVIEFTPFELEKISFEFDLDIKNISLSEIFNSIILFPGIPLASYAGIYKILKDFVPPNIDNWEKSINTAILIKICQKIDIAFAEDKDYTDCIILINNGVVQVHMEVNVGIKGKYFDKETLIKRLISLFHGFGDIKHLNVVENNVKGVFYIPNYDFDKYIFADLVMNNDIFNKISWVNESEKASKKKNSVYWHFSNSKTGLISANITGKISERGDNVLMGKDINKLFAYGTNYIRVKISWAENTEKIAIFIDFFKTFLAIYQEEFAQLIAIYKTYIPNFGAKTVTKSKADKQKKIELKLKHIAPEVFVKGWPQTCSNQPTVIEDEDVPNAIAEGKIVMKYPKSPNEGFKQRNYICTGQKAKYPSLRLNPLSNKDLVKHLPCCYESNHSDKVGSIYRNYYFDEPLYSKDISQQQEIIVTNKFVEKDHFGLLPKEVSKIFEMFDYSQKYKYIRKGVSPGNNSFLECVLEGMYESTGILNYSKKPKRLKKFIDTTRENFVKDDKYPSACKQEMYDFTIENIRNLISDTTKYFEPKYFTSLLESYFKCNIYVFRKDDKIDGNLVLPRYSQALYKRYTEYPSIFIYEHIGSTSDRAENPRCELIVRWEVASKGDITYSFSHDSAISIGIKTIYRDISTEYILDRKIEETLFSIPQDIDILYQQVDSYGKSRILVVRYKNRECTLFTTPVQPWICPIINDFQIPKISLNLALEFAANLGIIITGQITENNIVKEIQGKFYNVGISIPIIDTPVSESIPRYEKSISYPKDTNSTMAKYNMLKKTARYVLEYLYWIFSRYVNANLAKRESMNDTVVEQFIKESVIIDQNFVYPIIKKSFTITSPILDGKGKIRVKSQETLNRLVYMLRVAIRRNRKKIMEYHLLENIENYYIDSIDFDQHQSQAVLQGESCVEKWIQESSKSNMINSKVLQGHTEPYFFRNSLISNDIYIAQNVTSLEKAYHVAKTWITDGYNLGISSDIPIDPQFKPKFMLYSYKSSTNITPYKIAGSKVNGSIKIIGYKNADDIANYTVLLSFRT